MSNTIPAEQSGDTVTVQDIREAGQKARASYGDDLNGLCDRVNELVGEYLIDTGLPRSGDAYTVEHVRIGPDGRDGHYICSIPGKHSEEYQDDVDVYVDAALTQFSDEALEAGRVHNAIAPRADIPTVVIAGPEDEYRSLYHDPVTVPGDAGTPNALTVYHHEALQDSITRFIDDNPHTEIWNVSARLTLTIKPPETDRSDALATIEFNVESSLVPNAVHDNPASCDDPLRAVHDDILDATPSGYEFTWNDPTGIHTEPTWNAISCPSEITYTGTITTPA